MARRRGRGGRPEAMAQTDDLGVGGLAGELAHGEREVVESVATSPQGGQAPQPEPGGGGQPQGGARADQDIFAPSNHPEQPPTSGLPMGAGRSSHVLADDPDEFLRVLHESYPHPDLLWLLENREF